MKSEAKNNVRESSQLKSPFPYYGGKSRVAHFVWDALGDPDVYVEPFFGSGAVHLSRPHAPRREVINDVDGFVANFWRSLKLNPAAVIRHVEWPANEVDLLARHRWLCQHARKKRFLARMQCDPNYYNAKMAGWWVWLLAQWIGSGCCDGEWFGEGDQRNHGAASGRAKLPRLEPNGIFSLTRREQLPRIFEALSKRLRHTIVACGDWQRVTGNCGVPAEKRCGVFLDPPYDFNVGRDKKLYRVEKSSTADVLKWCRERSDNPKVRIVLAGFEGEYDLPGWSIIRWGGKSPWGRTGRGLENLERERLWLSPSCQITDTIRAGLERHASPPSRRKRAALSKTWKPNPRRTPSQPSRT